MFSSVNKKLFIGVVLGFLIYAIFAFMADLNELLRVGGLFPWAVVTFVLLLASGNYIARMIRWHMYLKILNIDLEWRKSAVVFLSGLAMSITPGKFGELLKAQYIKNINGTGIRRSAPVVLAERLTDLIGVLVLSSLGVFHFSYGEMIFFLVLGVIVLAIGLISSKSLSLWFIKLLSKLPFLGPRVHKLEEAYENISTLVKPGQLLAATFISVLAWGCECFGFYLVLNSFPGIKIEFQTAFFIYAFSILVGAVSMLPGGLGVTEGTMAGLLVLLAVPGAEAVGATIITRLATLWFAVILGLICTAIWRRMLEGRVLQASS